MRRSEPRRLADALERFAPTLSPPTLLASVQTAWESVAGPAIAREASPVSERAGVVTVACRSAVWAQELELLSPTLVERLNAALGLRATSAARVDALRFVVDSQGRLR